MPSAAMIDAVPLGDVAGATPNTLAASLPNPYAGNAQAIEQGRQLFVKMNCAGCHGYAAKGGMGPNLTDKYWRYGGAPAAIYKSIAEGRPQGMPAWGLALPSQDIWRLVGYIQSLGGTVDASGYEAALQGDMPGEEIAPEEQPAASTSAHAASHTGAPPESKSPITGANKP